MKILIIAEHDNQRLSSSLAHLVTGATKLSNSLSVLVAGAQCDAVAAEAAEIAGVSRVICVNHEAYRYPLAEAFAPLICQLAKDYNYIIAPATTFGKNILPRVAATLDMGQISDVIEILEQDTFKRPVYAGNAFATVKSLDPIKLLTLRPTAFPVAEKQTTPAEIISMNIVSNQALSRFVQQELNVSSRPELASAKTVVSGGRGMQNGENFKLLEQLADCLGAAIGASRAAVDAGYVPNDYQVGQTGKIVAPDLYIAIGISGAIQHLAGMKESKVIVAINKDPDAPIFQIADYGLVGDLFTIVPEMIALLK